MAAETMRTTPEPDERDLEEYVDQRLFGDSMGTLADHAARKAALGDTRRYALMVLLWERDELARKELAAAIDDDSFDLTHHLTELIDVGFVARTGAPEDADGRQTFTKSRILVARRSMQITATSLVPIPHHRRSDETGRCTFYFTALETAVEHFLDRGYSLTIAASDLNIFVSDYDAPFLEAHVPADPPPDSGRTTANSDEQPDRSKF